MRWACCAVIAVSACYSPTLLGGAPCEVTSNSCPTGQTCVATGGGGGVCTSDRNGADAGGDGSTGSDAGGACAGKTVTSKLLGSVCLSTAPTAPVSLGATINTGTVAATTGCTQLVSQAGGPSLCVIAGTTIDIPAGATVRAVALVPVGATTTATNPLVLIATQSITIEGTLDVSSHFGETIGGTPSFGAGARTPAGCFVAGVDGQSGAQSNGGGGGAGGSFGTAGAQGGTGGNNGDVARGAPAPAAAPTVLVGGCPGGYGGDASGGGFNGANEGGAGGNPGGAVFLFAGDSIAIAGKINASGSGGGGGGNGVRSSGGGGGGGAGGMIGLEAARITVTGSAFANGGGGGAGGGNAGGGSDVGNRGSDPASATAAAPGGNGSNNGGNGGAGSVGSTAPVAGKNGSGSFPQCGGGGGGGGAGVIRVFGPAASAIGGTVSPPAT